jgi:hypothetical protein
MTEVIRKEKRRPSIIGIIALIISIAALALAWMAYDRTGANLEQEIKTQVQQGVDSAQRATERATDAIDKGPDGVDEDDTDVTPAQ